MTAVSLKIEPRHLRLRAIVYVRQSTPRQVLSHPESARRCQSALNVDPGSARNFDPLIGFVPVVDGGARTQARFLKRQLSLPVSMMSQ
jgi:hypothetical protein